VCGGWLLILKRTFNWPVFGMGKAGLLTTPETLKPNW